MECTTFGSRRFAAGALLTSPVGVLNKPGTLTGWYLLNKDAAVVYLQIFDKNSEGSVGTSDTPKLSLGVPAGAAANAPAMADFLHGIVIRASSDRVAAIAPGAALEYNLFFDEAA
jgi:hypothetical protein